MSREEKDLEKAIKKATSKIDEAPKRKHVRTCIVYTWDHKSSKTFFNMLKMQPYSQDSMRLFKALILLHKVLQEGHPSALVEGIRNIDWIDSLGRIFHLRGDEQFPGIRSRVQVMFDDMPKLVGEYVYFLVQKLNFHKTHKGFNGTFEYEEYVSLVSVSDPNQGYETILDLMNILDTVDGFQKLIFVTMANIPAEYSTTSEDFIDCRGATLLALVSETYGIYKFISSMIKALNKQMDDPDALAGLFKRYAEQCERLNEFYFDCNGVKGLKKVMTIPKLPNNPLERILDDDDNDEVDEVVFADKSRSRSPDNKSVNTGRGSLRRKSVEEAPPKLPERKPTLSAPDSVTRQYTAAVDVSPQVIPISGGPVMALTTAFGQTSLQSMPTGPEFWTSQANTVPPRSVSEAPQDAFMLQQNQVQQHQLAAQMEQQRQLQQQCELLQQRIQQQELEKDMLIQQKTASLQTDLVNLRNQYERDQVLLQQYDERVQKLENELGSGSEYKEKYDSLAKLYSQLRQEHLNVLKKSKKLQDQVSADEAEIEHLRQMNDKLKQQERSNNVEMGAVVGVKGQANELAKDRSGMILKSLVESSIKSLQDPIASLDVSDLATDLSNAFIDGDINTIVNILPEFVSLLLRCPQEMQTIAEDFLRCLSSAKQTDSVINANIAFQEKLKRLGEIRQYSYRYGDSDEI